MSEKDNGGPAFPRTVQAWNGNLTAYDGMTLRDWFAGQVVTSILSHPKFLEECQVIGQQPAQYAAKAAYAVADALLEARK